MAIAKTKAPRVKQAKQSKNQLRGRQLASLLQKLDRAKSPRERKRLRREFLRGFYGDSGADSGELVKTFLPKGRLPEGEEVV